MMTSPDNATVGPIATSIARKLSEALSPGHLDVVNESHMHSVAPDSEAHFKVTAVASAFEGKPLVQRHRAVNRIVAEELQSGVHALALHLFTPEEWSRRSGSAASPRCLGGSKQG